MILARRALIALLLVISGVAGFIYCLLFKAPLPSEEGTRDLPGLSAQVQIDFGEFGIPRLSAANASDAFEALGFVTARDRLFQMDLLRRKPAGRLAEIFGGSALKEDRWNRVMGFSELADIIVSRLPAGQRRLLEAYAAGVNQAIAAARMLPIEFTLLGYRPGPWRPKDSILLMLAMDALLSWSGDQERTATVMRQALPPSVVAFLTPESDCYNEKLSPLDPSRCAKGALPLADLIAVMKAPAARVDTAENIVASSSNPNGSNAWVVGADKTRDGRTMLANDMHLGLSVPNIWYRAELRYEGKNLSGLTLPGLPLVIAGSNGRVAWGLTSVEGDFADLVAIEEEPGAPGYYRTPEGILPFGTRTEIIRVRGGTDETVNVRTTVWGPVLPEPLLGRSVAVRWTALDPEATDLGLSDLAGVKTVTAAIALVHRAGGPPLNVLLADDSGNIGWTFSGKIPKRFGMDGLFSESWADGSKGWDGYVPPDDIPAIVNPAQGYIVSANNRMLGTEYQGVIGHDFASGFRAWRITELLRPLSAVGERDMLGLQLDTGTEFYRYYQHLALRALEGEDSSGAFSNANLRQYIEAWDGRAEPESLGLPLLAEFRAELVKAVLAPLLAKCRDLDPSFQYRWNNADVPVQQIIGSGRTDLLPGEGAFRDWNGFLLAVLVRSAQQLVQRLGAPSLAEIRWGDVSRVEVRHPLTQAVPFLGPLLNMADAPLPGCLFCVRSARAAHGATERMVVAPGHESEAILHMPGGQSGQPSSPHYSDQQQAWVEGRPIAFSVTPPLHRLTLMPKS